MKYVMYAGLASLLYASSAHAGSQLKNYVPADMELEKKAGVVMPSADGQTEEGAASSEGAPKYYTSVNARWKRAKPEATTAEGDLEPDSAER